jgi:hypothetical protein
MKTIIFTLIIVLVAGTLTAKNIKNKELKFSLEVPKGFVDFPDGKKFGQDAIYSYVKGDLTDQEPDIVIIIERMKGTVSQKLLGEKTIPKGADIGYELYDWGKFKLECFVIKEKFGDIISHTRNIQIPLKKEAIQLKVIGLASKDEELKNITKSILKSLNGISNWKAITDQKEIIGPISITFPKTWVKGKSKTGLVAVYKSPTTHKVGGGVFNDLFYVRVSPSGNATLTMMKVFLSQSLKQSAQKISAQFKKTGGDNLKGVDLAKLDKFTINEIKIDGVPALELKNHSVLMYKGGIIEKNCRSIIILIDKKFYNITANYDLVQEKELNPMADKFLKSIKITKK